MTDPHAEIARIEETIETLSAEAERCRKIDFGAKIAIGGGALWIAAALGGVVRGDTTPILVAISAVIGGIVLFGSNRSSWRDITERLDALREKREQLIDAIDPRRVGNGGNVVPISWKWGR